MRDQVKVEGIVKVGWDERFEDFVRLLARGALGNPAEPLGNAKYVRIYRKPGQDGSKV